MVDSVTIKAAPTPPVAPPATAAPVVPPATAPKEAAPAILNPGNAPAPKPPERPAWLPSKFKDAEQMASAYAELEKRMGGGEAPKPATDPAQAVDPNAAKPIESAKPPAELPDILKAAGFDQEKLNKEVAETGDMSKESYAALYAKFGKAVVDQHVAGMKAVAREYSSTIYGYAGGADNYGKVMAWAVGNVPAAEAVAYNEAVNSGDTNRAKLAVEGLTAKYNSAVGSEPTLLNGDGSLKPGAGGDVYRSWAQVTADMRDPRYNKDPAYRADVEARLGRSSI